MKINIRIIPIYVYDIRYIVLVTAFCGRHHTAVGIQYTQWYGVMWRSTARASSFGQSTQSLAYRFFLNLFLLFFIVFKILYMRASTTTTTINASPLHRWKIIYIFKLCETFANEWEIFWSPVRPRSSYRFSLIVTRDQVSPQIFRIQTLFYSWFWKFLFYIGYIHNQLLLFKILITYSVIINDLHLLIVCNGLLKAINRNNQNSPAKCTIAASCACVCIIYIKKSHRQYLWNYHECE